MGSTADAVSSDRRSSCGLRSWGLPCSGSWLLSRVSSRWRMRCPSAIGCGRCFFIVASAVVTELDTAAVLLTPVAMIRARHPGLSPLPFAVTTVEVANTVSLLLPLSNLTNLLAEHELDGVGPI